ncbi:MAG: hypothetical protein EA398_16180 [Deltaproteobacteria bacterium]|nr:MAG: hypothetical protein EA398_16180 [Deltaproteobacteria bacterium]
MSEHELELVTNDDKGALELDHEPPRAARQSGDYGHTGGDFLPSRGLVPALGPLVLHASLPLLAAAAIAFFTTRQLGTILQAAGQQVSLRGFTADHATAAAIAGWDPRIGLFWLILTAGLLATTAAAAFATATMDRRGAIPIAIGTLLLLLPATALLDPPALLLDPHPAPDHAPSSARLFVSLPAGTAWAAIAAAIGLGLAAAWHPRDVLAWGAFLAAGAAAWLIGEVRAEAWLEHLHNVLRTTTGTGVLRDQASLVLQDAVQHARWLLWGRSVADVLIFITPWWAYRMALR